MPIIGDFGGISARGFGEFTGSIVYTITPSVTSVNEGSSVTFTVSAPGFGTGTLYWTLIAISGTVNNTDFSSPANAVTAGGSVAMTNSSGSFSVTLANDATTEGAESFAAQLRTDSTTGTIVKTSATVTISDTSLTPFFPPFFPFFPYFPFFPPFFPFFPYFPFFPPFFPFFPYFPFFPPFFPFFPSFGYIIPWFGPPCVEENTLVDTIDGPIPAKFLKVGDKLKSYAIAELDYNSPEYQKYLWNSETFTTGDQFVETEITAMISSEESDLLCFNENFDIKITFTQPTFIKDHTDGLYKIKEAYYVEVGDSLIIVNSDGSHLEVPVTSIDYLTDELVTVYEFSCEPYDWFFVGGVMVHNK